MAESSEVNSQDFDESSVSKAVLAVLDKFFKSNEFKEMFKKVSTHIVSEAVEKATSPLLRRIEHLEEQLDDAKAHANDNEQYSRKYNLRFIGIDENEEEDCLNEIVKLCNDKLNVEIDKNEVDRAHRVGPKSGSKARPIIVKFKSYDAKFEICKKRKNLKGTHIYINEDLTKFNAKLFNFARKSEIGLGY
jgi:hypothetical protein